MSCETCGSPFPSVQNYIGRASLCTNLFHFPTEMPADGIGRCIMGGRFRASLEFMNDEHALCVAVETHDVFQMHTCPMCNTPKINGTCPNRYD